MFSRIGDPLFDPPLLLVFADVQEKFQDGRPVFGQVFLEAIDLVVALRPHAFRHQFVDPDHEHVFILRTIKNPDVALLGYRLVNAPEKIVRQFLARGLLEGRDLATLRART